MKYPADRFSTPEIHENRDLPRMNSQLSALSVRIEFSPLSCRINHRIHLATAGKLW
jgi:hypothetical protein